MNFKKYITMGMMATALVACDNVDENERFIPVGGAPTTSQKNILIEDFTGMKCVNCPDAAAEIQTISNYYAGRIVSVALHPQIEGFYGPLANEIATTYAEHYGIESLPKGMVDRQVPEDYDKWSTTVHERSIAEVPSVNIAATTDFEETSRQLTVSLNLTAAEALSANLQLWLTESNIVSFQLTDQGYVYDYTHNHVLRDAVNGTWGEAVELGTDATSTTYTYTIPAEWDAQNMAVVAFVSNADGVLQVIEQKLFETETPETPAAPKMELSWNGTAAPANITLQATEGIATLSDLLITNAGAGILTADVSVEIVENQANADIHFTLNDNELSQSSSISLAAAEVAKIGATASFAPNAYGTAKATLTITSGETTTTIDVVFNNPEPVATTGLFQIINNGEVLTDGATIEVASTFFEYMPGMGVVTSSTNNAENGQQLMVKNLSDTDQEVTYTVTVLDAGAAHAFQLCAFNACYPLEGITLSRSGTLLANTEITTDWHAEFTYGEYGTAKTMFTVTIGEETQTIYVNFNYTNEEAPSNSLFQIINNGEVLADGATIEVESTFFEYMPGMGVVTSSTNNTENSQQLMVKSLADTDQEVTYTVTVLEAGAAHGFQLCAFNACYPLEGTTLSRSGTLLANAEITTDWHADFAYGEYGTAKTMFTVTIGEETQTIYVNFIYQ